MSAIKNLWPWPVPNAGSILATVCCSSVHLDFEIPTLLLPYMSNDEGAEFLFALMKQDDRTSQEFAAAERLSAAVEGLPMALSLLAGQARKKGKSTVDLLQLYCQNAKQTHDEHPMLPETLGTALTFAFDSLDPQALALVSVMSFLASEHIPIATISFTAPEKLPAVIAFCGNETK